MNDPQIDRILQEAKDEGDGRAIALIVLLSVFVVALVALYVAHGGKLT